MSLVALPRGERAWWRALGSRLARDADLRSAVAYVAVNAALRADFIWLGDQMNSLWRAATLALLAGFVNDTGVALGVLGLVPRGGRFPRARAGLFAFGVLLTVLNLRTLAALNVPFDPLMLTYVGEPVHTSEIESPIPLALLGLHLTLAWGALFAARALAFGAPRTLPEPARTRLLELFAGALFVLGSRALSGLDYRATQVSHADGFSWLSFQLHRHAFGLPAGTEPRSALLTPAASLGQEFADERFPLVRGTPYALCRAGIGGERCQADADGDGAPLRDDCDDGNRAVHPGAVDVPSDGVDQDCSGLDAGTPDVLVLELEGLPSHVLRATGGSGADLVMPELDALTRRADARLFTHYETAAGQTAPGFASAMCSLMPHYGAGITRAYSAIGLRCLPAILAERGYEPRMIQNGDANFDNQREFAEHAGFFSVEDAHAIERAVGGAQRVSHWGLVDAALFHHLRDVFAAREAADPPLFVLAQSISNHYPYALPDPRFLRPGPGGSTWRKARSTSAYVDYALGGLVRALDALARVPGRRPLLVVMSGDHGHPAERHAGNRMPASALYDENVHTPLVLWAPGRPELLARLDHAAREAPCSSLDLMPTLLGLLGVQAVNAAMGRDLALPSTSADRRAVSLNPLAGGLVRVRRESGSVIVRALPPALEAYAAGDGDELHDLGASASAAATAREGLAVVFAAKALIEADRVWPRQLSAPAANGAPVSRGGPREPQRAAHGG